MQITKYSVKKEDVLRIHEEHLTSLGVRFVSKSILPCIVQQTIRNPRQRRGLQSM